MTTRRIAICSAVASSSTGSVRTAGDGPTALAMLAAEPCDAVLLDIMMPGQSGLEVLAAIRADAATRQLPVIMVRARGDSRDVVEARP